ncbi:RNA polymerase sigma factor (sigma-70 family) [Herbihabitans rhizosphaerae]|uniref:RNA polymerase sigma factor (Sigma-70 family) n=1 Tax=Herbihabitans rhizosphaerae TaxID=1872711 RepID=A0A4Q7L4T9_9PSEU|nr:sigma-70 family RNA polymerase sigma factor [Herbihabitans rhizosphaerae]RZS44649.1 RNA polymerase sigma factor (sigma-70 family) [Herbihabitans rhizosphaerae]
MSTHLSVVELLELAGNGDRGAWRELVERHHRLVWKVALSHRLNDADAADVSQATWLILAEKLGTIRRPDRLAAWLTTTARRESLRVLAMRRREVQPSWDDVEPGESDPTVPAPEDSAVRGDRDRLLWTAFATLPEQCRKVLGLLAYEPDLTLVEIGRAVGLSPASITKTRTRCLTTLHRRVLSLGIGREAAG